MPKIREYENEATLRPSDKGMNATADAAQAAATSGYRIGQMQKATGEAIGSGIKFAGNVAADMYTRHVVQPEIAKFNVLGANAINELTLKWNELAAKTDPNNTKIADEFREKELLPTLERLKSGMNTGEGQKHAEDYATRMLGHFDTKLIADTSHRAGIAVQGRIEALENKFSTAAMSDPSSMDFLLKEAEHAIRGEARNTFGLAPEMSAKIETTLLQRIQKTIAQAALLGMAKANPEAAEKAIADGRFSKYFNGVEEYKAVRALMSAARVDNNYARIEEERRAKERSDKAEVLTLQNLYSQNPADRAKVSTQDVLLNPDMSREAKERTVRIIERETKPETATRVSNANTVKLFADIRAGKITDLGPIDQARINGDINKADHEWLRKEMTDRLGPTGSRLHSDRDLFFKKYEGTIDGALSQYGTRSGLGQQRLYQAEKDARDMEENLKKAGKDPASLYDPNSPNFFGRPEVINKYRVTYQQDMDYQKSLTTKKPDTNLTGPGKQVISIEVQDAPIAKRLPGETVEQWRERTKPKPSGLTAPRSE